MKSIFISFLLPLLSAIGLAMPMKLPEKTITRVTTFSLLLPSLGTLYLIWEAFSVQFPSELELAVIKVSGHEFPLIAWIDHNTLALLGLSHLLGLLVVKFSHGYLHLEKGYQRFFSTILFFIFGMQLLSLAGNMDIFFAGWEIVGFSSFLLIAFYRSHSRSVSNAWRIYNLYRVCDLGLLISAVLGHVLWHEATRFAALNSASPEIFTSSNQVALAVLSISIVLASLGKSAQFPFHTWPARAMEGPTPSSAIFYGALSIHAGVFLLIRTQPLWSHLSGISVLIGLIGVLTLILSSIQGQIQTNIKGQIAYASTSQIGLMFIELSLGFSKVVLIHLVCHALYRCFQLLVSPSVVASSSSLNNKVIVQRIKNRRSWTDFLPVRWRDTLYVLGMTDFSMDISRRGFGFLPWRATFRQLKQVIGHRFITTFMMTFAVVSMGNMDVSQNGSKLALIFGFVSLFFSLKSIIIHNNPFYAMRDLAISITGCMMAVYLLDPYFIASIKAYIYPVLPFLMMSLIISWKLRKHDLRTYHALGTAHRLVANLFMISFMVLSGMPVTTAFIGEDMLLEGLLKQSPALASFISLCLMINGLLMVKVYCRLFMGRPAVIKERKALP